MPSACTSVASIILDTRVSPSTPHEASAPRPVSAPRPGLSVDALALALAGVIAIAVLAGVLPAVPW